MRSAHSLLATGLVVAALSNVNAAQTKTGENPADHPPPHITQVTWQVTIALQQPGFAGLKLLARRTKGRVFGYPLEANRPDHTGNLWKRSRRNAPVRINQGTWD